MYSSVRVLASSDMPIPLSRHASRQDPVPTPVSIKHIQIKSEIMANKFLKQSKLPWTSKDVVDAIEERLEDLAKFNQEFEGARTDARSIRQRLTLQTNGGYPDSDDDDPTLDAAHKKSVDLVQDYKRLIGEVPAKAAELKGMQEEADDDKAIVDKILADGSPHAIKTAEVMKTKIPEDKMIVMVQAVATRHGSLDFLRNIGSEHRQVLLTKEAEVAEYRQAQQVSPDVQAEAVGEDELIPSTYPELDSGKKDPAELLSACVIAQRNARDLETRVGDLEDRLAAECSAHKSLRQQFVQNEDALKGKESALEQGAKSLDDSEKNVARLKDEAAKLQEKINELEEGLVVKDDLIDELRESRDEVERLKDQVGKMQPDVDEKSRLEEELVGQREKLDSVEMENEGLRQELKGKAEVLEACNEAKDSAQRLADKYQADLAQRERELENALSDQKETDEQLSSISRDERRYRSDYRFELEMHQATRDELVGEQSTVKAKEEEIQGLKDSIKSKDEEIQGLQGLMTSKEAEAQALKDTIESKEDSLKRVTDELEQVTYQLLDRDEQLQSQNKSVDELRTSLEHSSRDMAEAEQDMGFIIRLSNLSIRPAAADWTPLLRSLRVSDPIVITPDAGMPRQTWAILPSWAGSVSSEPPCIHTSLDSVLLELYGHCMAEGDIACNPCLQALCTLSSLVERQGVAKVSSLVLVLEKLEARLRGLEAPSAYEGMVMLGLRYLAELVRSRLPGVDVPGLSAITDSLDGMMKQADKCLDVIRNVSDGLCSSGDIGTVEANQGLRLASREGRVLVLLADSECVDELFLLADPEERTVMAVCRRRLDIGVQLSTAGELVISAVIKAPAGMSDIGLDLSAAEADWIQEKM